MTVDELIDSTLAAAEPRTLTARSVFWVKHGTRLAGSEQVFRNRYILVRVEAAFGACAVEEGELDGSVADLSGSSVAELLTHPALPVRIAALDAYLGAQRPHRDDHRAETATLPTGTPDERAVTRDAAVASLLDITPGQKVALIGVVNPLVAAIRERGGECLPCDLTLKQTQWGDPVTDDMSAVLAASDSVLATGMTVGNGSFDRIRETCQARGVPLTIYAQSAAAVAREFLGDGVTALSAEPMPFSQLSADASPLYLYRSAPR